MQLYGFIHACGVGVEFVDLRRRSGIPIIAELRDAELLEDLKDLFNTLSVDGNDAKYQDFRFSFRIHMSLAQCGF